MTQKSDETMKWLMVGTVGLLGLLAYLMYQGKTNVVVEYPEFEEINVPQCTEVD